MNCLSCSLLFYMQNLVRKCFQPQWVFARWGGTLFPCYRKIKRYCFFMFLSLCEFMSLCVTSVEFRILSLLNYTTSNFFSANQYPNFCDLAELRSSRWCLHALILWISFPHTEKNIWVLCFLNLMLISFCFHWIYSSFRFPPGPRATADC